MDGVSTTHRLLHHLLGKCVLLLSDELATTALHVAHLIHLTSPLAFIAIFWHVEDNEASLAKRGYDPTSKLCVLLDFRVGCHEGVDAIENNNGTSVDELLLVVCELFLFTNELLDIGEETFQVGISLTNLD